MYPGKKTTQMMSSLPPLPHTCFIQATQKQYPDKTLLTFSLTLASFLRHRRRRQGGERRQKGCGDDFRGMQTAWGWQGCSSWSVPSIEVVTQVMMTIRLSPPEPAAHGKFVLVHLLFLLLPWRSYGPASAHATVDVLLFLLCWFQDLSQTSRLALGIK